MEPNQPQTPTPLQPQSTPADTARSRKKRTILALCLIFGPTLLAVVTILAYAILNYFMTSSAPASDSTAMLQDTSVLRRIINVVVYLVGALVALSWLPGLITGIILLATRKKA